jgi:hypothetical protein
VPGGLSGKCNDTPPGDAGILTLYKLEDEDEREEIFMGKWDNEGERGGHA